MEWAALNHQTSFLVSHPVCCDNANHRDKPATGCTSLQGIEKQSMYPQVCRLQMMNTLKKSRLLYSSKKIFLFAAVNFRPALLLFTLISDMNNINTMSGILIISRLNCFNVLILKINQGMISETH